MKDETIIQRLKRAFLGPPPVFEHSDPAASSYSTDGDTVVHDVEYSIDEEENVYLETGGDRYEVVLDGGEPKIVRSDR